MRVKEMHTPEWTSEPSIHPTITREGQEGGEGEREG